MALRKQSFTQPTVATWAASTLLSTALERIGVLTRIDVTSEITPSATLTGANQPDGLFRPLQNLNIRGSPSIYTDLPSLVEGQGGTLLHYLNKADRHGLGHPDGAVTAPSLTFTTVNHVIHCGTRPRSRSGADNPFDMSAFIPASLESSLTAEWRTTPNTVMDDTVTISSAVQRYTLHRLLGTDAEIRAEIAQQKMEEGWAYPSWVDSQGRAQAPTGMMPAWQANVTSPTATTTSFETLTIDLPHGNFVRRIAILAQDATATRALRAEDELTELAIVSRIAGNERLLQIRTQYLNMHLEYGSNLEADDAALDFGNHVPKGIYIIPLHQYVSNPAWKEYGLNMRAAARGDMTIGTIINTNASGDDLLTLFEVYQPYYQDRYIHNPN